MTCFSGFCGIDWMHDRKTDRLVAIEFNPRPTPGVFLSHWLSPGKGLIEALRDWVHGRSHAWQPPVLTGAAPRIPVYPRALYKAVSERDLAAFFRTLGYAPWDDPLLLLSQMKRFLSHYVPDSYKAGLRRWR
ncbi:MAG: hypothetical protein ACOYOU_02500 [Kiritimatiellia bacterium]